jgi:hypothetical protein
MLSMLEVGVNFDSTVPSILLKLIDTYGISLLQDTNRFESMLRDVLPDKTKELYLLTLSLHEEGLFSFTNGDQTRIDTIVFEKHKKKLQEKCFLLEEAIEWVVSVWKYLLVSYNLLPEDRLPFIFSFEPTGTICKEQKDLFNELQKEHDVDKELINELGTVWLKYRKLSKESKEVKRAMNATIQTSKKKIDTLTTWLVVLSILLVLIIPVYELIRISTTHVHGISAEEFDKTSNDSLEYNDSNQYGISYGCDGSNIELSLVSSQRVWVRIKYDENFLTETLEPSSKGPHIFADDKIILQIGNAGGLHIRVNGVHIPNLGSNGELIDVTIEYIANYIKVTKSNDKNNPLYLEFSQHS